MTTPLNPPWYLPDSLHEFYALMEQYGEFEDEHYDAGTYNTPAVLDQLDVMVDKIDAAWKQAPVLDRAWANACLLCERAWEWAVALVVRLKDSEVLR